MTNFEKYVLGVDKLIQKEQENLSPQSIAVLYNLQKTLEEVLRNGKKKIANELGVGYSDVFPEINTQIQVLQGRVKDSYDYAKIRKYIGATIWNRISTVTKTDLCKAVGPAEANKCFALALSSSEIGEPIVDIRPVTKKTKDV